MGGMGMYEPAAREAIYIYIYRERERERGDGDIDIDVTDGS
jgi:hypothetical protein